MRRDMAVLETKGVTLARREGRASAEREPVLAEQVAYTRTASRMGQVAPLVLREQDRSATLAALVEQSAGRRRASLRRTKTRCTKMMKQHIHQPLQTSIKVTKTT